MSKNEQHDPLDRDATTGRFLPANRAAEQHGVDTLQRRGAGALPPELRMVRQERVERMLTDLAGAENLSTFELGLVDRAAQLSVMLDLYEADFEARGMWTQRGRQRASVAAYLAILDRYDKIAMRLGLQRRAKDVPMTIEVILEERRRQREEEARKAQTEPPQ